MNRASARDAKIPDVGSRGDAAVLELVDPRPTSGEELSSASRAPLHRAAQTLYILWTLGILALLCLHFPHLLADFPNNSPWMDYSKYTDEGWYGNATIRYFLTGHWYLHGDFNPAVALPIWPLLLALVFHFTGVSLIAARTLALVFFGLNLLLAYCVVRTRANPWVALLAVTLLASSPFLWAFSRLAILESPLVCFLLLSWLIALRLPRASTPAKTAMLATIGLLLCLMILTKTTAIFIIPSTLFLVARACQHRRDAIRSLGIAATAAALPWCAWYFLLVRPHYLADYKYLFEANHWPQPTTFTGWLGAFWWSLHGSLWISPALCIAAVALLLLPFTDRTAVPEPHRTSLWRSPLTGASLLAMAGYVFFAGWHNSPQPRYYETVIYPLCFVLALGIADLLGRSRFFLRATGAAALAVAAAVSIGGVIRISNYLRHPEFTFINAAQGVTRYIDQHPEQHRLLLSISGDNIQFITGQPAICDDYGTWDLPYRIHVYQPGWYAAWNDLDPGSLVDIQTQYSLERVAAFPAFDDPDRNLLVLYRMVPLPPARQNYSAQDEISANAGK
jgi:4-amino-4-deoxy-L-arabinose transferase-like glycosyltransferase